MPYQNEHSCRLREPSEFQKKSFRRISQESSGHKTIDIIIGKLKGESKTTAQAFRYPKDEWSASEARDHCESHNGKFEAARKESTVIPIRKVVIKSEDQRLVYGEVYSPLHVDTDGEAMTAEAIQKMAHRFLSEGLTDKIDVQHNYIESGCRVVESFIARKDDPDGFIEGAWVLGVKVSENLWSAVKSGELNGFSFAGAVTKIPIKATVVAAKRLLGETEKSESGGLIPKHVHSIDIMFDDDGTIIPGQTSENLGHFHDVKRATATERTLDHSHRLILIEND